MKKIIDYLLPPPKWRFPVILTIGILFGLGFAILHIANATSYLSDDPKACVNCHVMTTHYVSWANSSHANVATCNDCHVPQDNILKTYAFKASDGLRHTTMFTFRLEPEVIRIKEAGINVVQENCVRCHTHQVHMTTGLNPITVEDREMGKGKYCWDCHRETPHGRVGALSTFQNTLSRPKLNPVLPEWLEDFTKEKKTNK